MTPVAHQFMLHLVAIPLLAGCLGSSVVRADDEPSAAEINRRLYQQLDGQALQEKIETVSGQMYVSEENIEPDVVRDAVAAMLDRATGPEANVAVRRAARVNFEIYFPKNSAELTEASRAGLDALGEVLRSNHLDVRFTLGGHTDLDGDEAVNGPLSQARAEAARSYLVDKFGLAGDRLEAKGFGQSDPLRRVETNAQDKRFNRRVDLRPLRD